MLRCLAMLLTAALAGATLRGQAPPAASSHAGDADDQISRLQVKHLPNVVRVHAKVLSGGQPEGDAGFAALKSLGVRTVISVDGAKPDVPAAAKHGLRYVHLPHGYDGIPTQRVKELAKAVRDLEGPIYIHCHHGKHRSPAAASAACVAAGLIQPESARSVLEVAGTSEAYRGLFQSAEAAEPLEQAVLDRLLVEFRASAKLPPMAEAMVAIEQTHDRLKEIAANGWQTPADHPDLDPAHEALQLREHFTELLRTEQVQREPTAFRQLLQEAGQLAGKLEQALKRPIREGEGTSKTELARAELERVQLAQSLELGIAANCKSCHQQFRDVPLGDAKTSGSHAKQPPRETSSPAKR